MTEHINAYKAEQPKTKEKIKSKHNLLRLGAKINLNKKTNSWHLKETLKWEKIMPHKSKAYVKIRKRKIRVRKPRR